MYFNINWKITIGDWQLMLLHSAEVHRSVDLLADTCEITLPASVYNYPLKVEDKIKPGARVVVQLGYDNDLRTEFEGWLQRIDTDGGSLKLICEDDLYLLRKSVKDKEFKNTEVKGIAQYVLTETGAKLDLNCTLGTRYDKFVIAYAEGYEVLKKLQDETKCNIYIRNGVLNIHPLYTEKHGYVSYSFQQNIESDDLKYRRAEDRKVMMVITTTDAKGNKIEERYGDTGGEQKTVEASGMNMAGMKDKAIAEHKMLSYTGYEGSITGWLRPWCEPGYSVSVKDDEYPYKDGSYYASAVTTSIDGSGGGKRKVQLGIKLN